MESIEKINERERHERLWKDVPVHQEQQIPSAESLLMDRIYMDNTVGFQKREIVQVIEDYAKLKHADYEKTYNSQCSRIDQLNERIAELEEENRRLTNTLEEECQRDK